MNLKDYFGANHLYVDWINGSDGNDGRSWSTPLKTIAKALELIQGLITINFPDGQPSWITSLHNYQRMPALIGTNLPFRVTWRRPGDGYVYFRLDTQVDLEDISGSTPFALNFYPGPEVKVSEGSYKDNTWLYDGLISSVRYREFPNYGIKLGLYADPSMWAPIEAGLAKWGDGDGVQQNFSGTFTDDEKKLPIVPGSAVFSGWYPFGGGYIQETFSDDGSGNLSSPEGGTGTIDYDTSEFSVHFANAPGSGGALTEISRNWNYEPEEGESVFTTGVSMSSCDTLNRLRNVIHLTGGIYNEIIPTIRCNVELDGTGLSFGNGLLYLFLGGMSSESTILPPAVAEAGCLLPIATVYTGILSTDGCNFGLVTGIGDGARLAVEATPTDTTLTLDSWRDIGLVSLSGLLLKIGHSSAPSELLNLSEDASPLTWDTGDDPEPRESVPGGGYDIIVLKADNGAIYDQWTAAGVGEGKMTLSLIFTGIDLEYSSMEKINEGGTDKTKFNLTEPINENFIRLLEMFGGVLGSLPIAVTCYNCVIPLNRPLTTTWPADTNVDIWTPACVSDLYGLKYEFKETAFCSSTAGIVSPALLGLSSVVSLMSGLWEMDFSGRNAFFMQGKGSPAFLNYCFLPKRKKFNQTYFLFLGDCHVFDFPPMDIYIPTNVDPMHFSKVPLDQLSSVGNCTIAWLNSGGVGSIIRTRGGQMYDVKFAQNYYAKTVGRICDWALDFLYGIADPDILAFEIFTDKRAYPANSNYKDENPMTHADEFLVSTIPARVSVSSFPSKEL